MAAPHSELASAWSAPELPETRAYQELVHTHGRITNRSSEIFRRHEITEQQYHVLRVLEDSGPGGLPCLELARRLPTPAPDITRLIDRLRRGCLVRRQRLERDRRVVMIELTTRGRRVAERLRPELAEHHRERLSHMSAEELDLLHQLLQKVAG